MSKIIIGEQATGVVVHEIDTSNLSESGKERAFLGVCARTDLDKFFVNEGE